VRNKLVEYRGPRTQEIMAKMYNVTQQAWSKWENGQDTPRPAIMYQIAKDAGSTIEAIFFDDSDNEKLLDELKTGTD